MTKLVRIEWQIHEDEDREHSQVETRQINNPCDMAVLTVHSTQYLVIKEV